MSLLVKSTLQLTVLHYEIDHSGFDGIDINESASLELNQNYSTQRMDLPLLIVLMRVM